MKTFSNSILMASALVASLAFTSCSDFLDREPLSTLSKILCKWKQDSVVSLFLYLNSVFKHKHKLIHNQAPV